MVSSLNTFYFEGEGGKIYWLDFNTKLLLEQIERATQLILHNCHTLHQF